jgi:hypothetical protein
MLKTVSSITNAIGALNYKGTWDANANSPALTSSVGTKGDYYVVGTAGATNLNGITNWGIGDWAAFNGSVWQRVEGGANLNGVDLSVSGTTTLSGLTASTALALDASNNVVSVANTGTGSNVLATAPTLVGDVSLSTGNLSIATSGKGITSSSAIPLGFGTNGSTSQVTVNTSGDTELASTTQATTSTAAASLKTAGGLAVAKKAYFGDIVVPEKGVDAGIMTIVTLAAIEYIIFVAASGMFYLRCDNTGNSALCIYETSTGTVTIIAQIGTGFVTGSPGASEIQIKSKSSNGGVAVIAGASRAGNQLRTNLLSIS